MARHGAEIRNKKALQAYQDIADTRGPVVRDEIRKAYSGRAPRVLAPFAGAPLPLGDAARLRSDSGGHQSGRLVHPQMH